MSDRKAPPSVPAPRAGGLKRRFPFLQKKRGVALVVALAILPLFGLLGLLALRNRHSSSPTGSNTPGSGNGIITDDTFFYGQSEPVYPSRKYFLWWHSRPQLFHFPWILRMYIREREL